MKLLETKMIPLVDLFLKFISSVSFMCSKESVNLNTTKMTDWTGLVSTIKILSMFNC